MRKAIILIVVLVVLAVGAYLYLTRPLPPPTQTLEDVSEKPPASSDEREFVYAISQTESRVEFIINEVLSGLPNTVTGSTNQVAGFFTPSGTGTVKIDANSFKTDDERRDNAIRRFILKSAEAGNEFIVFDPELAGLNFSGPGEFTADITGDLTISGVLRRVVFRATVAVEDERIVVVAESRIKRSDFGLTIPSVPFVADVDNELTVRADIVLNLESSE